MSKSKIQIFLRALCFPQRDTWSGSINEPTRVYFSLKTQNLLLRYEHQLPPNHVLLREGNLKAIHTKISIQFKSVKNSLIIERIPFCTILSAGYSPVQYLRTS